MIRKQMGRKGKSIPQRLYRDSAAAPGSIEQRRGRIEDMIRPRLNPRPPPNSVNGEHLSMCPRCGQKTRVREFHVFGPYTKEQVERLAEKHKESGGHPMLPEARPRITGGALFRPSRLNPLYLAASPYAPLRADRYYVVYPSAKCRNDRCSTQRLDDKGKPKLTLVDERIVVRRFGWWGIAWIRLMASLRLGIAINGSKA